MKTQVFALALPIGARRNTFAKHQLLLPERPPLLCDDALEPKPLRDTCAVLMARLPGRAAEVVPSGCVVVVLP